MSAFHHFFGKPSAQAGAEFSPSVLFANGELGMVHAMSDIATLRQSSDGSGAVSSVSDPVGWIEDLSGNGNHSTQATNGDRPTMGVNGDGTNFLAMGGAGAHFDFAENTWASSNVTVFVAMDANADNGYVLMSKAASDDYIGLTAASAGGNANSATISQVIINGVATATTTDRNALRQDLDGGLTTAILTATTTSDFNGAFEHGIWNPALTAWRSDIRLYAYGVINRHLTTTEKANLTEWLQKKNGVI